MVIKEEQLYDENRNLAELIGIIRGDGSLRKNPPLLSIRLDCSKGYKYVEYVVNLIKTLFSNIEEPTVLNKSNSTQVTLRLHHEHIIDFLFSSSDFSSEQENRAVPLWIKYNDLYKKAFIRGLFDADGWITVNSKYKAIYLGFSTASERLIKDYWETCNSLGIKTGKISCQDAYNSKSCVRYKQYQVYIAAKDQVRKFLFDLIKPIKWTIEKEDIEKKLNNFSTSIEGIFEYKYKIYNNDDALIFKTLYEKFGTISQVKKFLKESGIKNCPSETTIIKHIENYFMKNEFRKDAYEIWIRYNTNIILDSNSNNIVRFSLSLRKLICEYVAYLLKKEKYSITDSQILFQLKENFLKTKIYFGRILYLLDSPKSNSIITNFILNHIKFVRKFLSLSKSNEKIQFNDIREDLELDWDNHYFREFIDSIQRDDFDFTL